MVSAFSIHWSMSNLQVTVALAQSEREVIVSYKVQCWTLGSACLTTLFESVIVATAFYAAIAAFLVINGKDKGGECQ